MEDKSNQPYNESIGDEHPIIKMLIIICLELMIPELLIIYLKLPLNLFKLFYYVIYAITEKLKTREVKCIHTCTHTYKEPEANF